jgi:ABC-2 type transport system ATP-binding protein
VPEPAIRVAELEKTFRVPVREAGLAAAARSLFRREHREVRAVDRVSFVIEPGEIVGFLGPNGAGKTTTLKMLSGLLYPTGGEATVLGHVPSRREGEFLRRMTMVMGNRNQLQWDLPALDSFELLRAIYRLEPAAFRATRDEFIDLLDLGELVTKPVRNLSLGERMKMELIAALLHQPQLLLLDEPTIGLDVVAQVAIQKCLRDYHARYGMTMLLTSHYMRDVEALCSRVLVINQGRVVHDGPLSGIVEQFGKSKLVSLHFAGDVPDDQWERFGEIARKVGPSLDLKVDRTRVPEVLAALLDRHTVVDMSVQDPPLDQMIALVFQQSTTPQEATS